MKSVTPIKKHHVPPLINRNELEAVISTSKSDIPTNYYYAVSLISHCKLSNGRTELSRHLGNTKSFYLLCLSTSTLLIPSFARELLLLLLVSLNMRPRVSETLSN